VPVLLGTRFQQSIQGSNPGKVMRFSRLETGLRGALGGLPAPSRCDGSAEQGGMKDGIRAG